MATVAVCFTKYKYTAAVCGGTENLMNELYAGFATVNIDPPLGIPVAGYYVPRFAKGFLDHLEASALTLKLGESTVVIVSVDHCGLTKEEVRTASELIEQRCGIPRESVLITSTHTHTAPITDKYNFFCADTSVSKKYAEFLYGRIADAAALSLSDLKEAKMGYAVAEAPDKIAYIRRYKMKDGTTMTCPPINDPNIDRPLGVLDRRINVLRFERSAGAPIVLVNYGLHSDTVNGELISADWPGVMRRTLDLALGGVKCIFLNGAEGDVGSTNVHVQPTDGDMNDTEISFDNEMKSPGMARFVGRAVAGAVLTVYDKVKYTDVDRLSVIIKDIALAANLPKPEELPLARKYKEYHDAGRDDLIPYTAMELTTVVAEALRMCSYENGPEKFYLPMTAVRIGSVALIGIPGEPFTDIGVEIKKAEGFDLILPCSLANGSEGYFPSSEAYLEGGYEARTSPYKSGAAETIISEGKKLLCEI